MRTRDENKQAAIYRAAMELVTAHGLEHTSMSKIARKAGVSASTLYVYFDNKEDMLGKLYLMAKKESSAALFAGVRDDDDVETCCRQYLRNLFHYMKDNYVLFSFVEQFCNSPALSDEVREAGIQYFARAMAVFRRGVDEGVVKDLPLFLIQAFFIEPIQRLVRAHYTGVGPVTDDLLETAIDMAWNAVRA